MNGQPALPSIISELEHDISKTDNAKMKTQLICITLDILAHCYTGKISTKLHAKRFKNFTKKFGKLSEQESEVLYQMRNSLSHFYGEFSVTSQGKTLRFSWQSGEKLVTKNGQNRYSIDADKLNNFFIQTKKSYLSYFDQHQSAKEKCLAIKNLFDGKQL